MRAIEFIFESYPLAKKEFSQMAKPDVVQTTIDQYRELVRKNQFRNPEEKNINYWRRLGWEAFSQMVKVKSNDVTDSQLKKGKVLGNAITLQDDAEWVVLIPLDKETSVHYGKDTEWCTTKPYQSYFENYVYHRNITLIYAIDKTKAGRSVAIALYPTGKIQMFNQQDKPIDANIYTEISGLDSEKFIQLAKLPENQQLRTASREKYNVARAKTAELLAASPLDPEAIERELKFTKTPDDCYDYIAKYSQEQKTRVKIHPSIVAAVSNHDTANTSDNAGRYIDFTIIPTGVLRSIIRTNPQFIIYNTNALTPNQQIVVTEYETSIKDDPEKSYQHAVQYNRPFPAGEAAIATNVPLAVKYDKQFGTKLVSQETNTEWEQSIKDDPFKSYEYARALGDRFPAGEAAIASNAECASNYAKHVINKPFPAGEAAIATNAKYAYEYAMAIANQLPNGRFTAGEPAIAKNSEYAVNYALHVLNGEFPAGEKSIAKNATSAYHYATRILNGKRFPAGEPAIAKNKMFSVYYAMNILNGEFPAAEASIAKDAQLSFMYAAYAIKRRFPAGEAKIATHKSFRNEYNELFGTNLARP